MAFFAILHRWKYMEYEARISKCTESFPDTKKSFTDISHFQDGKVSIKTIHTKKFDAKDQSE